eukprot:12191368-Karenia_brevis.AAC.1
MDGSYQLHDDTECASWAFAVLAESAVAKMTFHGALAGPVVVNDSEEHYVGADSLTPLSAELCAVLWALQWAIGAAGQAMHRGTRLCEAHKAGKLGGKSCSALTDDG